DEVNDRLRARLPEGDWDTIGGLVYDQIGHVPAEGESVTIDGWRLTAQRIQGRRIGRGTITRESPPSSSPPLPPGGAGGREAGGATGNGGAGRSRGRDDRGQIGDIEALPFGILIFVVGTLLVLNVWSVIDAKLATDAAATQAARTFVEADVGNGTTQAA